MTFVLGLLIGALAMGIALVPRLRSAIGSARVATEAERVRSLELTAAREAAAREADLAARLAGERESSHERQLAELRAATAEKIALLEGKPGQVGGATER